MRFIFYLSEIVNHSKWAFYNLLSFLNMPQKESKFLIVVSFQPPASGFRAAGLLKSNNLPIYYFEKYELSTNHACFSEIAM